MVQAAKTMVQTMVQTMVHTMVRTMVQAAKTVTTSAPTVEVVRFTMLDLREQEQLRLNACLLHSSSIFTNQIIFLCFIFPTFQGSCFPDSLGGSCSGTPRECQDCNRAINCQCTILTPTAVIFQIKQTVCVFTKQDHQSIRTLDTYDKTYTEKTFIDDAQFVQELFVPL